MDPLPPNRSFSANIVNDFSNFIPQFFNNNQTAKESMEMDHVSLGGLNFLNFDYFE